jgi:CheY-like chemotaxis protein
MSNLGAAIVVEQPGRPLILVVDDEPAQLETICRGLFLYGYDSVAAEGTEQALAILRDPASPAFDLLVTDLTMPGASGCELITAVRRMRPSFPVLIITGLSLNPQVTEARARGVRVLQKPFGPDELDGAIRSMLVST